MKIMISTAPAPGMLHDYVKRVGIALASGDVTRACGRLLGWLLVCEPAAASVEQLSGALGMDRGHVSSTVSEVVRAGLVERVGLPGSRKTQYQLRVDALRTVLKLPREGVTDLRLLADEGLWLLRDSPPQRRERLLSMQYLCASLEAEFLTPDSLPLHRAEGFTS